MKSLVDDLQARFDSFIGAEPQPFLKGLSEYIAYATGIPVLQETLDAEIEKCNKLHSKWIAAETKSATEPKRFEIEREIERQRESELWGSVEAIQQFARAYGTKAKDLFATLPMRKNQLEVDELEELICISEEIESIKKWGKPSDNRFLPTLRAHAHLVHNYLISISRDFEDESSRSYVITKDSNGRFYYDGNPVHFPSPGAGYVKIFKAVFELAPHGGEVAYAHIKIGSRLVKKNAVLRALSGPNANLFQYTKAINPEFGGVPLFEAQKNGKYIAFNNKR